MFYDLKMFHGTGTNVEKFLLSKKFMMSKLFIQIYLGYSVNYCKSLEATTL